MNGQKREKKNLLPPFAIIIHEWHTILLLFFHISSCIFFIFFFDKPESRIKKQRSKKINKIIVQSEFSFIAISFWFVFLLCFRRLSNCRHFYMHVSYTHMIKSWSMIGHLGNCTLGYVWISLEEQKKVICSSFFGQQTNRGK